jgi:class 3 adenylate cyclase
MARRLGLADEVRLACQLRPECELRVRRLVLDETDLMMASQLDRSAATRTGEAKNVAIFFSDIADFTSLSERLSPYDTMYLLNRYFAQAGDIIEKNGGFIDKFVGDGLMAIFGVDDQPDAPLRSVNAALQTLAAAAVRCGHASRPSRTQVRHVEHLARPPQACAQGTPDRSAASSRVSLAATSKAT